MNAALAIVTVSGFLLALFAPGVAESYIFSLPIVDILEMTTALFGRIPIAVKLLTAIAASILLVVTLTPGIVLAIREEVRTYRLRARARVDSELRDWVLGAGKSFGLRTVIEVAVVPTANADPMLYTRIYGLFRNKVLIVVAEELLDRRIVPRPELLAALAHEIAHARLDTGLVALLAKISLCGGLGRGFLSLAIDYHEMENRADEEAARYVGDASLVAHAIQRIRQLQNVHLLHSACKPARRRTMFYELMNMISFQFRPQVLSAAYPDTETRLQRLDKTNTLQQVQQKTVTGVWTLPLVQWTLAFCVLLGPTLVISVIGSGRLSIISEFASSPASTIESRNDMRALSIWAGDLLVATRAGLWQFDPETEAWSRPEWLSNQPLTNLSGLEVVGGETFWVSSYTQGLAHYRNGNWTAFTAPDDLPSNVVMALSLAPDGSVWIGTAKGLSIKDTDSPWKVDIERLLLNTPVIAITGSESLMAVATPKDLRIFQSPWNVTYQNYTADDFEARHIVEVNYESGKLWIFTDAGLYSLSNGNESIQKEAWLFPDTIQGRAAVRVITESGV